MTPFKTIWSNLSLCNQLTPFKTIWPNFIIVYPIESYKTISPPFLKWSWKESTGYTMIKLGKMVLKAVSWVDKTKISWYGLERSHLGTQL